MMLNNPLFQYLGTISLAILAIYAYKYARANNHILDNKILLFWLSLDLGLVSISRIVAQLGLVEANVGRSVSGLIGMFVLIGFLLNKGRRK